MDKRLVWYVENSTTRELEKILLPNMSVLPSGALQFCGDVSFLQRVPETVIFAAGTWRTVHNEIEDVTN